MFRPCDNQGFDFDSHLIAFLTKSVFYAEFSRNIRKVGTEDVPTATLAYDKETEEFEMAYNPSFFKSLTNIQIHNVIKHELHHGIFGHVVSRRRFPPPLWNVSTDLANNSVIVHSEKSAGNEPLPKGALIPSEWPLHPEGRELSKEEKEGAKLGALIASFPTLQSSEWYHAKLLQAAQKEMEESGREIVDIILGEGLDSFDDHDPWDDVPEEEREMIEQKLKDFVSRAVKKADQTASGWGSIPAELREELRRYVSTVINWRAVLRQFVGTIVRVGRATSMKKINRRYPYVHPGVKRGYVAKLLLAVDQSGSVYNEMLEEFFAEMSSLARRVDVSVLPFDCTANERDIFEWKRGTSPKLTRVKCGGTDFNAPTEVFNDPKNRGRWNGILVLTDGCAPQPIACRGRRGWVLGQGCELQWKTDELQIKLTKDKQLTGAWR